jgi:hypothetical protein
LMFRELPTVVSLPPAESGARPREGQGAREEDLDALLWHDDDRRRCRLRFLCEAAISAWSATARPVPPMGDWRCPVAHMTGPVRSIGVRCAWGPLA